MRPPNLPYLAGVVADKKAPCIDLAEETDYAILAERCGWTFNDLSVALQLLLSVPVK